MNIAELRALPDTEKFMIIETLWADLTSNGENIESPFWHGLELEKTEADYRAGKVTILDWAEAKKGLINRLSNF